MLVWRELGESTVLTPNANGDHVTVSDICTYSERQGQVESSKSSKSSKSSMSSMSSQVMQIDLIGHIANREPELSLKCLSGYCNERFRSYLLLRQAFYMGGSIVDVSRNSNLYLG